MRLINLELKRNNFKIYGMAAAGIFAFCLVMAFAFPFLAMLEKYGADRDDMWIFSTWSGLLIPVSGLVMACFSVLAAVLAARMVVAEYNGKNAILLFSYPVRRRRVLQAKCRLIWGFTAACGLISETLIFLIMGTFSNIFHLIPEKFQVSNLGSILVMGVIMSILAASVGQVSMRIGYWKKSPIGTVVAAVIMISPMTNLLMLAAGNGAAVMSGITAVVLAAAIGCYFGLMKKINVMEV